MTSDQDERRRYRARILRNIREHGCHITLVHGGPTPRFVYTIGRTERDAPELILAGGYALSDETAALVVQAFARLEGSSTTPGSAVELGPLGAFALRPVNPSWTRQLALGLADIYDGRDVAMLQVVPLGELHTADIPDMTGELAETAPNQAAWRWCVEDWDLAVPDSAMVVTNVAALLGAPVTEAARWEVDEWEIFAGAGPEVLDEDARRVPLGTLLALDPTIHAVLSLRVGEGLWRGPTEVEWHPWRAAQA